MAGLLPKEPGSLEIVAGATDVVGGGLGIFNLFVEQRNSWEERRKEGTTPKSQRPREGSLWDTLWGRGRPSGQVETDVLCRMGKGPFLGLQPGLL